MPAKPKPTKEDRPKKPKTKKRIARLDPDKYFSLCVRERADWTCESCGKKYEPYESSEGLPANQGLHCSHYIGRANYAVRFDPLNANAHCYGCHAKFEGNPHMFREWKEKQLGSESYGILIEKSINLMLGKKARKEKQEIAEHYKDEFTIMLQRREKGILYLGFNGYL